MGLLTTSLVKQRSRTGRDGVTDSDGAGGHVDARH